MTSSPARDRDWVVAATYLTGLTLSGESEYSCFQGDERREDLGPLRKVNIFVGPNNGGKSRLIRRIASHLQVAVYDFSATSLPECAQGIERGIRQMHTWSRVTKIGDNSLGDLSSELGLIASGEAKMEVISRVHGVLRALTAEPSQLRRIEIGGSTYFDRPDRRVVEHLGGMRGAVEDYGEALRGLVFVNTASRTYIPTLRGVRYRVDLPATEGGSEWAKARDHYAELTKDDYFSSVSDSVKISTGMMFYATLRSMLLGDYEQRRRVARYEKFLAQEILGVGRVVLIPREADEALHIKIDNEKEQPVASLGDGLQQIIVLTFAGFEEANASLFFIEEPELFLHPGLQRRLLSFFISSPHQYFFTTHSNHLLDIAADYGTSTSIFLVEKRINTDEDEALPEFSVTAVGPGERSPLESLGVRTSSVFLVNSTIWVEGVTDRQYLRRFLGLYLEEHGNNQDLREDVHYAFVEYGGGNVVHFDFAADGASGDRVGVRRLCSKMFLVADGDGGAKTVRDERLSKELGDNFYRLPVREVENLLPPHTIWGVVRSLEDPNRGDPLPQTPPFKQSAYAAKKLGFFVEKRLEPYGGSQRVAKSGHPYAEKSGTIKGKVDFMHRALGHLTSWDELSEDAQKLTKAIYEFILKQNGG